MGFGYTDEYEQSREYTDAVAEVLQQCGAVHGDSEDEVPAACTYPAGHGPITETSHDILAMDHGNPAEGIWWNVPKPVAVAVEGLIYSTGENLAAWVAPGPGELYQHRENEQKLVERPSDGVQDHVTDLAALKAAAQAEPFVSSRDAIAAYVAALEARVRVLEDQNEKLQQRALAVQNALKVVADIATNEVWYSPLTKSYVEQRNRISAIRQLRADNYGLGLAPARDYIDKILEERHD